MGLRGPAPKPTKLRLLDGNPGKRPINKHEPQPREARPPCPRWLEPEAKNEWRRVVPELERLGLLTVVDRAALSTYCQAWARYVEAEKNIERFGAILKAKGSDYFQVSPYVTISKQNAHLVKSFCMEFGFTPSSRSRISINPREDDDEDEWEGLLD